MMLRDGVRSTQSPYWLCINGWWVRLEGVTPGSSRTPTRPSSDFLSVDGLRYVQQAPLAAREWALDLAHATPAAIAALSVAAEAPGEVLLHDTAAARANMLPARACYGHDQGQPMIRVGAGFPLRAIEAGTVIAQHPVRGGVPLTLVCWTLATAGNAVTVTYPGGTTAVPAGPAPGPSEVQAAFTPAADGLVTITAAALVTALQLVEGAAPAQWLAGERTPCPVAVGDAARVLNLARSGRQGTSDYSVTLREVG